ncbi:retrotransposon protein, putative, ty3-gypsy subclass [Tanacetum coccineum]
MQLTSSWTVPPKVPEMVKKWGSPVKDYRIGVQGELSSIVMRRLSASSSSRMARFLDVQGDLKRPEKDLGYLDVSTADGRNSLDDFRMSEDFPEVFKIDLLGFYLMCERKHERSFQGSQAPADMARGLEIRKTLWSNELIVKFTSLIVSGLPSIGDTLLSTLADVLLSRLNRTTRNPRTFLQQPEVLCGNGKKLAMDFISKLPYKQGSGYDIDLVIVDRLTSLLISYYSVRTTKREREASKDLCQRDVARLWCAMVSIISDRDGRFTSHLCQALQKIWCYKTRMRRLETVVLLKVSPWKGVVRFGKKGKLAPRYVGPFEIIERVGPVAYRLKLPQELSCVHDTFHVSNLKKCLAEPDVQVPLDEIEIDENLRFVEEPLVRSLE